MSAEAEQYIAEGWRIVPVARGEKAPKAPDWPNTVWSAEQINGGNVGVILGPVSKHLCDIDLDSYHALALAPHFLPQTATFGRASKPRSHWLYYCEGLRSQRFTFERAGKVELVEVRAQNASNDRCGHQSVFPGSVHASGEAVVWDPDGSDTIATVERGALLWAVTRLSVACVIVDGHEPGTQRNNKARAWAAGLLQMHWTADEVRELFAAVYAVSDVESEQRDNDLGGVERTIEAYARGDKLQGFGTLIVDGLIDEKVVRRVEVLARTPTQLASDVIMARSQVGADLRERIVREAQNTDGLGKLQDQTPLLLGSGGETPGGQETENFFGKDLSMTERSAPIEYVCAELGLAPGKISIVAGYSGTSKGPFLNQLALCIASGKHFLGFPVAQRKVAFFDFETGEQLIRNRMWRMANALGIDRAALGEQLTVFSSARRIDDEWLTKFDESVEPGMVCFIDSYTSAVTGEMNSSEYAYVAWQLGKISERRAVTIIVAMHSRKSQQGRSSASLLEAISGHASLSAAAQTAILISRPKEANAHLIAVKCARAVEDPFAGFEIAWADVAEPGQPLLTPGEKSMHGKWGLLAKRVENTQATDKAEAQTFDSQVTDAERALLTRMTREFTAMQAGVTELVREGSSATRTARAKALRNLVQRGMLLANFHWSSTARSVRQLVWLPGEKAEIGIAQD